MSCRFSFPDQLAYPYYKPIYTNLQDILRTFVH